MNPSATWFYSTQIIARTLPILSPHPHGELLRGCIGCDRLRKNRKALGIVSEGKE